jgi:hypothetical protein
MITDGWDNPIEVKVGGQQFWIGIIIVRDHKISTCIFNFIEVKCHRIIPVVKVVH